MEVNFESIVILIATQAMINLGEIKNPITGNSELNLRGAEIYIKQLEILKEKTENNLNDKENIFLEDMLKNLKILYNNKLKNNVKEN